MMLLAESQSIRLLSYFPSAMLSASCATTCGAMMQIKTCWQSRPNLGGASGWTGPRWLNVFAVGLHPVLSVSAVDTIHRRRVFMTTCLPSSAVLA